MRRAYHHNSNLMSDIASNASLGAALAHVLKPLLGAMMLKSLDDVIPREYFYVRYMDDWLIATNSCHGLRRVIKKMHHIMHQLGFKLALDKTFIDTIKRGFNFLGYRFNHTSLIGLAAKTIKNVLLAFMRQAQQGAHRAQYVSRWRA